MAERKVLFFDVDDCLYSKHFGLRAISIKLADAFFVEYLDLPKEEAQLLRAKYTNEYGVALYGLMVHHQVDPSSYAAKVYNTIPVDETLRPDAELRKFLSGIDRSKVKLWLFTNSCEHHGNRVVKALGVDDFFEGVTFLDHLQTPVLAKPMPEMFAKAMKEAGVTNPSDCYFVDDNLSNCEGADKYGWNAIHLLEPEKEPQAASKEKPTLTVKRQITNLKEIKDQFPELFRPMP